MELIVLPPEFSTRTQMWVTAEEGPQEPLSLGAILKLSIDWLMQSE